MLRVQVWRGEATEVKVGCSPWFRQREVQQAGRGLRDDSAAVSSDELHEGNEGQGESRVGLPLSHLGGGVAQKTFC